MTPNGQPRTPGTPAASRRWSPATRTHLQAPRAGPGCLRAPRCAGGHTTTAGPGQPGGPWPPRGWPAEPRAGRPGRARLAFFGIIFVAISMLRSGSQSARARPGQSARSFRGSSSLGAAHGSSRKRLTDQALVRPQRLATSGAGAAPVPPYLSPARAGTPRADRRGLRTVAVSVTAIVAGRGPRRCHP
jgi:hypothetical protein